MRHSLQATGQRSLSNFSGQQSNMNQDAKRAIIMTNMRGLKLQMPKRILKIGRKLQERAKNFIIIDHTHLEITSNTLIGHKHQRLTDRVTLRTSKSTSLTSN